MKKLMSWRTSRNSSRHWIVPLGFLHLSLFCMCYGGWLTMKWPTPAAMKNVLVGCINTLLTVIVQEVNIGRRKSSKHWYNKWVCEQVRERERARGGKAAGYCAEWQIEGGGRTGRVLCWAAFQPVSPFESVDAALTWPCHLACAGSGGAQCKLSGLSAGCQQEELEELWVYCYF